MRIIPLAFSFTVALGAAQALAVVISVPGDFPTISDAVDAANPGDTIEVSTATYPERVKIRNLDNLALVAVGGGPGSRPVIQPSAGDDGIRVRESIGVSVIGFRIEGGKTGIRFDKASNSGVINDNEVDSSFEGIRIDKCTSMIVSSNDITNAKRGRGIRVKRADNSTISGNDVTGSKKEGLLLISGATISVTGNTVTSGIKEGIRIKKTASVTVDSNTASGNGRTGIRAKAAAGAIVSNNVADANGRYGLRIDKSSPIGSTADLLAAGNTAAGNTTAQMRVNKDIF